MFLELSDVFVLANTEVKGYYLDTFRYASNDISDNDSFYMVFF